MSEALKGFAGILSVGRKQDVKKSIQENRVSN